MNELRSDELAQLVSLGGWLRGAEALTAQVLQNYSNQNAELLRQPALLNHFEKRVATMSGDIRANPMMIRMREGMEKIRPVLESGNGQISKEKVKEISTISEDLLKDLGR
jgi:hypothetical protein